MARKCNPRGRQGARIVRHEHDPASVLPLALFLAALAIMIYKLLNGGL
jgi:hypothetical protein